LSLFVGSVALEDPSGAFGRPSVVRISIDGAPVEDLVDQLFNSDGPEWDTLVRMVTIPAGATSLTVQALSMDAGTGPFAGNLPASMTWVASGLVVPPACTGVIGDRVWFDENGNGCQDEQEPGVAGANVTLINGCGGTEVIATTTTDEGGYYRFDELCAGEYRVVIEMPEGLAETTTDASCEDPQSDSNCDNGEMCVLLMDDNTVDLTNDCGLVEPESDVSDSAGIPNPNTGTPPPDDEENNASDDDSQDDGQNGADGQQSDDDQGGKDGQDDNGDEQGDQGSDDGVGQQTPPVDDEDTGTNDDGYGDGGFVCPLCPSCCGAASSLQFVGLLIGLGLLRYRSRF
jgi:hypothetical protein